MKDTTVKTLRLILGDQLNHSHSWYKDNSEEIIYLMMELKQETEYVKHHIQKVVGFFSAMRGFAKKLRSSGYHVIYLPLDDKNNKQDLSKNILSIIEKLDINKFEYQLPDEYRLDEQLNFLCKGLEIPSTRFDTEHFLTQRGDLEQFFDGKNTYLMESFYRSMRKKYGILMEGNSPLTGQWNYDASNRKKLPKNHSLPDAALFKNNVSDIHEMVLREGVDTIGNIQSASFSWPIDRNQALEVLDYFVKNLLVHFGDYQDAMTKDSWTLYHSRISFAMNIKLVSPIEVVKRVIEEWEKNQHHIHISQVEGFVRQIIGWREYMRGIYWAKMPKYKALNFLEHQRQLPSWFWTGNTKMECVGHAIQQSLDHAYAHHIQRLMVTGNFMLLAGIDPDEVDEWYLGIYIDAIEWVEITNTRGMSQFADGGIVGTKPYVSSANYIDKMSHYCKDCFYDKKQKTGPRACPFNSLYWHFYDRHESKLSKNPRIGMMYRLWNKMDSEKKGQLLAQADEYLENIELL